MRRFTLLVITAFLVLGSCNKDSTSITDPGDGFTDSYVKVKTSSQTYYLKYHSVTLHSGCGSYYTYMTFCRSDGVKTKYYIEDMDYILGPTYWITAQACCTIEDQEHVYIKPKGTSVYEAVIYACCYPNYGAKIKGEDKDTGGTIEIKFSDLKEIDFP